MRARYPAVCLLWEGGGLWAWWSWLALAEQGMPPKPVSAAQVAAGELAGTRLLLVPGGWPRLKYRLLGGKGRRAVRRFVEQGGIYLGICGGAGLALSVEGGLGLLPLGRTSGSARLPSLSGPVFCRPGAGVEDHPLWRGLDRPQRFFVWFPGQFAEVPPEVEVVASFQGPAPGLCSADLEVDQVARRAWGELERSYGLRLDPAGLAGLPAAIQGRMGRGEVLLSYLHFDTPGHAAGRRALANLWRDWLGMEPGGSLVPPPEEGGLAGELWLRGRDLWELGMELGLWRPRHPAMPLWRRGARGLEFWSLLGLLEALARCQGSLEGRRGELEELSRGLEPLWRQAPGVLKAQAAALGGDKTALEDCPAQVRWFPRPRRVAGELGWALERLEQLLFSLLA